MNHFESFKEFVEYGRQLEPKMRQKVADIVPNKADVVCAFVIQAIKGKKPKKELKRAFEALDYFCDQELDNEDKISVVLALCCGFRSTRTERMQKYMFRKVVPELAKTIRA